MSTKKYMAITYPIIMMLLAFDQVLKMLTTNKFFSIIPNVLSVHYSENTGAAWSLFSGNVTMLAIISVLFLAVLIFFSHRFKEKNLFYCIGYSFIIGGAFGNLTDRIFLGFVRDFIKIDFINFPIFNFADIFLVAGVIMFALFALITYPENERKFKEAKEIKKLEKTEKTQETETPEEKDEKEKVETPQEIVQPKETETPQEIVQPKETETPQEIVQRKETENPQTSKEAKEPKQPKKPKQPQKPKK